MLDKIKEQIAEVESYNGTTKDDIEQFRIKYLGKKGLLNDFFCRI
jgi:phenylalanyl-tRNA synthetase alpha chain